MSFLETIFAKKPTSTTLEKEQTLEEARAMINAMPLNTDFNFVLKIGGEVKAGAEDQTFSFPTQQEKNDLLAVIDEAIERHEDQPVQLTIKKIEQS